MRDGKTYNMQAYLLALCSNSRRTICHVSPRLPSAGFLDFAQVSFASGTSKISRTTAIPTASRVSWCEEFRIQKTRSPSRRTSPISQTRSWTYCCCKQTPPPFRLTHRISICIRAQEDKGRYLASRRCRRIQNWHLSHHASPLPRTSPQQHSEYETAADRGARSARMPI